ncbi:hypothetical protein [Prosthecobacter fluviatilis]|uniref:Uncharacterized protein n=1 Tax=Prosthecobacter fluviatilis TaxID=445931 RepID=A0ABW0KJL0_9BACT
MKTMTKKSHLCSESFGAFAFAMLGSLCLHTSDALAQMYIAPEGQSNVQTNKDAPADFHKYYGQRVNSWRDRERQIAKIDLDADMNQDGNLSNTDPADGGSFEATPPGMILGVGELTRIVIRVIPYRVDFDGHVVVSLEAEGINRGDRTGEYATLDDEMASMGHIRVWRDAGKKQLLLDTRDPAKRLVEFTTSYKTYPYNLPLTVPRYVFVEGVRPSPKYSGDIRLLVTVSHRSADAQAAGANALATTAGKEPAPVEPEKKTLGIKSFRTSFDHILFTVQKEPLAKQFVNDNNAGVWVPPPGKKYIEFNSAEAP